MKEIYNYNIERYSSALILTCDFQNFILSPVTQLALPKSKSIFRELRSTARYLCIVFYKLFWCIVSSYSIGKLIG